MVKHALFAALSLASLLFIAQSAASAEPGAQAPTSKPATAAGAPSSKSPAAAANAPSKPTKPSAPFKPSASSKASASAKSSKPSASSNPSDKPSLGDGIIAQNALRIYLNRPATVTVHNARGQLLFHVDTSRPLEYLPLSGVHAGFLYLTIRSGHIESTRKLIYSGK